jgi:IS30 family transposase
MAYVAERLRAGWSPEQIAGRLSRRAPTGLETLTISHTTIYRWIWGDPQRADEFRPFLRIARKPRRKKTNRLQLTVLKNTHKKQEVERL